MDLEWYVRTSKGDRGPYSTRKFRKLADEGKVKPDSIVSRDGKKWIKASQVRGLEFTSKKKTPVKKSPDSTNSSEKKPEFLPWYEGQGSSGPTRKVELQQALHGLGGKNRPTNNTELTLRNMGVCTASGMAAAGLIDMAIRFGWISGLIEFETIEESIFIRFGIYAFVFCLAFCFAFWVMRRKIKATKYFITEEMTDQEIYDTLENRWS